MKERIHFRAVSSVNNAITPQNKANGNNDGSIPVRTTNRCAVKSWVDSLKLSQKSMDPGTSSIYPDC